jgi:FHA domain-containing protein
MILTLSAVSLDEQPLSQPITAVFDARGGTIGRADHNTMALPDPQRHVSRLQAQVVAQGAGYLIRNVGAANAIMVGGRALGPGETMALAQDAPIRIGGYLLKAQFGAPPAEPTVPSLTLRGDEPEAGATDALPPGNPFADLLGAAGGAPGAAKTPGDDPFAGFMPAPAGVDPRSAAVTPAPAKQAAHLPDDFDLFAGPAATAPPAPAATDPFADLLPAAGAPGASIDEQFGLSQTGGQDPLAAFMSEAEPGQPAGAGLSTDPLALFGGSALPPPLVQPAQPDDLPAVHGAFTPPRATAPATQAPAEPVAPLPAARAAGTPDADALVLWAAFCEGAGIEPGAGAAATEERMRRLGRILRSAVEGTLRLMAVRASTKHELRAGVTVIQARNNNPLKFAPDAKAGVEQLVQPPMRGFLDGPAAMDDAMVDLVGHSIGTVAGLRAAVEGMLDRFAPQALEAQLVGRSMLDNLLPMSRRARLWDLYLQHHRTLREEAQEDFHTLFGKAFLAAYEQQVERLKRDAAAR